MWRLSCNPQYRIRLNVDLNSIRRGCVSTWLAAVLVFSFNLRPLGGAVYWTPWCVFWRGCARALWNWMIIALGSFSLSCDTTTTSTRLPHYANTFRNCATSEFCEHTNSMMDNRTLYDQQHLRRLNSREKNISARYEICHLQIYGCEIPLRVCMHV